MANMFTALKKYADFQGRARRSEYWLFVLLEILLLIGAVIVGSVLDAILGTSAQQPGSMGMITMLLYAVVALGLFVPALAVAIRRLHDTDKSGWFILLGLIPFLGALILLIFYCLDGTPGPNKFGPDPKARGTAETFS